MKEATHCVGYKLHKDNSPVISLCYSEVEQETELAKIRAEGYINAVKLTPEQGDKMLSDYGKRFVPRPLTQLERWHKWAIGN